VRQRAWLNTSPERGKNDRSTARRRSRLEQMRADRKDEGYVPELPNVDGAAYLVAYLWDIGPTMVAGMGLGPLTHEEIRAWQSNTGVWLQPWETRILRQLSMDYIVEMRDAEKPSCPAPWNGTPSPADLSSVADRMLQSIRAMAARGKK
jgi:hypothetical protein